MIELAPYHKIGLPVENPVLLAAGTIGYGEATPHGLDVGRAGAAVVGPVMRHSSAGGPSPRYASLPGGMVLASGGQNRGVGAVVKRFARLWPALGCPVIVQIADTQPELLSAVAKRMHAVDGVSGIEVLLPGYADADLTRQLLRVAVRAGDWPVWAKLPLMRAVELAPAAVDAGAVGLVVGRPLMGAASRAAGDAPAEPVRGDVYGPLSFAPMLDALLRVAALALPCALMACGGVHTIEQARQALQAGAHAVQVDSAVWVEPGRPLRLAQALAESPV